MNQGDRYKRTVPMLHKYIHNTVFFWYYEKRIHLCVSSGSAFSLGKRR